MLKDDQNSLYKHGGEQIVKRCKLTFSKMVPNQEVYVILHIFKLDIGHQDILHYVRKRKMSR